MRPLPFTTPYWIVYWLAFAVAMAPEFRIVRQAQARVLQPGSRDAGSMNFLLWAQSGGMLLGFPAAFWKAARLPAALQPACFWLGLGVLMAGALLRWDCRRRLGASFTGDVQARPGQRIVDSGPYAWVRHPAYSGGVLMFLGLALALGSWASLLLIPGAVFLSYHRRMKVEEAALLETLGEDYRAFLRSRKRIIPFLY